MRKGLFRLAVHGGRGALEFEAADHIATITRKLRAINASSSSAHFLHSQSPGF